MLKCGHAEVGQGWSSKCSEAADLGAVRVMERAAGGGFCCAAEGGFCAASPFQPDRLGHKLLLEKPRDVPARVVVRAIRDAQPAGILEQPIARKTVSDGEVVVLCLGCEV